MTTQTAVLPRRDARPATAPWLAGAGLVALAVAALVLRSSPGDYAQDAGPAINALLDGHPLRALQLQPLMGTLSVLVRTPFALAARAAGLDSVGLYRAGVAPCLVALGAAGVCIARRRRTVGSGELVVPLIAVASPAALSAVQSGHPEEALGAALVVAAILLAERHTLWAGVALGLAVATKQWAILAVPPVIWLTPRHRRATLVVPGAVVAALLTLPALLGAGSAFARTNLNAATSPSTTGRATLWYPFAAHRTLHLHVPAGIPSHAEVAQLPVWLAHLTHPLIVVLAPLLTIAVWRRRPTTADALALVSLILLLRCVLDPVDNEYYHLPFLVALLAYETTSGRTLRGLPLATIFSALGLWVTFDRLDNHAAAAPAATNVVYLTWTAAVLAFLVHALWRRGDRAPA